MAKERIFTIDIARAITIVLVAIAHYSPDGCPDWWLFARRVIVTVAMPLFMAVSGYTYIYQQRERGGKTKSYESFVLQKFQRLIIPYFFISVFVISVKLLVGGASSAENPVSLSSFYEMFYYPAAAPFLWFLPVLFVIFLIVPLFNSNQRLTVLLMMALVLYFVPLHIPETEDFSILLNLKSMLVFFVTGCLFYEWHKVRTFIMDAHFLIFLVAYILSFIAVVYEMGVPVSSFMASLFGIALMVKISKFISEKEKIQQFFLPVAAASFTIYLFHTTFMGFAKALLAKLPLQQYTGDSTTFTISAVIVISTGVIASMILHCIITRKSRILSYLTGAKYKNM